MQLPLSIGMAGGGTSSGLFCKLDIMTVAFQNGDDGPRTTYEGVCESKREDI